MQCIFCQRTFDSVSERYKTSSLKNHQIRCSKNPNRVLQKWKNPEKARKNIIKNSKNRTEEYRKKHSEAMKNAVLKYPESYSDKNIVGRSKHFTIDGVRYNSTWEYEVAKYLTEQNILWKRNGLEPEKYFWNDNWHFYFPDFYLEEFDCYVEVKGYETERDRQKWKHSKKRVVVIKQNELEKIKNKTYDIISEVSSNS